MIMLWSFIWHYFFTLLIPSFLWWIEIQFHHVEYFCFTVISTGNRIKKKHRKKSLNGPTPNIVTHIKVNFLDLILNNTHTHTHQKHEIIYETIYGFVMSVIKYNVRIFGQSLDTMDRLFSYPSTSRNRL